MAKKKGKELELIVELHKAKYTRKEVFGIISKIKDRVNKSIKKEVGKAILTLEKGTKIKISGIPFWTEEEVDVSSHPNNINLLVKEGKLFKKN